MKAPSKPNPVSPSVPITEPMRQLALQAIRKKGITKVQLAEAVGTSKSWATKFLDGSLRTIKESHIMPVEELLGIRFWNHVQPATNLSELALRIGSLVDSDESFAKLAAALEEALLKARGTFTPRFIPTDQMKNIGEQIIRICFADEDKPGKVARKVLEILA